MRLDIMITELEHEQGQQGQRTPHLPHLGIGDSEMGAALSQNGC